MGKRHQASSNGAKAVTAPQVENQTPQKVRQGHDIEWVVVVRTLSVQGTARKVPLIINRLIARSTFDSEGNRAAD
jgi:hypothetical protein